MEKKDSEFKVSEKTLKTLKIIVVGDSFAGKTSLINKYVDDDFQAMHVPTIGIDYKIKRLKNYLGERLRVQIWDTAGQERFRTITKSYYQNSHGVILVYDCSNEMSFDNMRYWVRQIRENTASLIGDQYPIIYIAANKCDTENSCSHDLLTQGYEFSLEHGCRFIEVSAKTGYNVESLFLGLICEIQKKSQSYDSGIILTSKKDKKKCCE